MPDATHAANQYNLMSVLLIAFPFKATPPPGRDPSGALPAAPQAAARVAAMLGGLVVRALAAWTLSLVAMWPGSA